MPEMSRGLEILTSDESKFPESGELRDRAVILKDLCTIFQRLEGSESEISLDDLGSRIVLSGGQCSGEQQCAFEAFKWVCSWMLGLDSKSLDFMKMMYRTVNTCKAEGCTGRSSASMPLSDITLEIGKKGRTNIGKLLEEQMNMRVSVRLVCNEGGCRYAGSFESLPEFTASQEQVHLCDPLLKVVVVKIRRWRLVRGEMKKDTRRVDLQLHEVQKMWEKDFVLMGVLSHTGNRCDRGHWVARIRDNAWHDSEWHEFSDGQSTVIADRQVAENAAVLVFRQVDEAGVEEFLKDHASGGPSRRRAGRSK